MQNKLRHHSCSSDEREARFLVVGTDGDAWALIKTFRILKPGRIHAPGRRETPERASAMLITDYVNLVKRTDRSMPNTTERMDIALYGLAGEVGSLVAAVKKRLLAAGRRSWNVRNAEIVEEIGDCIWYCFALSAASGSGSDFLLTNLQALQTEVASEGTRGHRIRALLKENASQFLNEVRAFEASWANGGCRLDDYQRLAFLTSRTQEGQLLEVCIAVLQQLMAELFRAKLPDVERDLNRQLCDRPLHVILGETAWHLAALASIYGVRLDEVAVTNAAKLESRFGRGLPTPLRDESRPESERLPRQFEVAFVTIGRGRSRMYLNGKRLGDDLTDNAYAEDGYRFHDAMHLALAGKLGWSPVLRKLMGRKRRSDPTLDDVEDGARAGIVEEVVINAIHAEGTRMAAVAANPTGPGGRPTGLLANGADIAFSFFKTIDYLVSGLEVASSRHWEWEDAIVAGFDIFQRLRAGGQGTVTVDLSKRSLTFSPKVVVDVRGAVACVGMGIARRNNSGLAELTCDEAELAADIGAANILARKRAVLDALGLDGTHAGLIAIDGWHGDVLAIRATGEAREAMWRREIVMFRASCLKGSRDMIVTAVGISDA